MSNLDLADEESGALEGGLRQIVEKSDGLKG
jgi:hypothetical protein